MNNNTDLPLLLVIKKYIQKVIKPIAGGMKYMGSKPTVADLPTASESNKGYLYTITANGHEHVSDGNAWVDLSQDLANKQDKLTAGTGIKLEGNTISADVRTYKPFPSSWPHGAGTTIANFCAAVNASYKSGEIKVGDAFLGNVNSTAFFNGAYIEGGGSLGSAEVSVQIMTPFGQNCVQLLTTTSSNNAPYHWEYTYVDGAASEGWRCWSQHSYVNNKLSLKQDKLTAGDNITIENNVISASGDVNPQYIELSFYDDGDTGTLTDAQAATLLDSELNYIWLNNMHRLDFRYRDDNNNKATYSAVDTSSDGNKTHSIEINLTTKAFKVYHKTLQEKLTAGTNITLNGNTISAASYDDTAVKADIAGLKDGSIYAGKSLLANDAMNYAEGGSISASLNSKQNTLVSGSNIKTINGSSIVGSGNVEIKTYQPFPNGDLSGTLQEVVSKILAFPTKAQGMTYLGGISGSCTPFGYGNVECTVTFMTNNIAVLSVSSSNIYPYHWEYNTYANDYKWRSFITMPDKPTDFSSSTYTLKFVNGSATWVKE